MERTIESTVSKSWGGGGRYPQLPFVEGVGTKYLSTGRVNRSPPPNSSFLCLQDCDYDLEH